MNQHLGDHLGDHLRRALQFRIGRQAHAAGAIITSSDDLDAYALRAASSR